MPRAVSRDDEKIQQVRGLALAGTPFEVQATTTRPKITVTADGVGVVSHAGSRLLVDLADRTMLTVELSAALNGIRGSRPRHDPGRVLVDLAAAIADGAEAISHIAVLADQTALFGPAASDSTCWRLLDAFDERALAVRAENPVTVSEQQVPRATWTVPSRGEPA